MSNNPFVRERDEYVRDFDIVGNYTRIVAKRLSVKSGQPFEKVHKFVSDKIEKDCLVNDPTMLVLRKGTNGDRYKTKTTLITYLKWVKENKLSMAPNMVAYSNVNDKVSNIAEFALYNLDKRSKTKKLMSEYFAAKKYQLGQQMNLLQSNFKLFNNSISGATSSPHNSLYFGSSHTSLTSACRSPVSFANSLNEKTLASNRTYFTVDDALASISDLTSRKDINETIEVLKKYNVVPNTVDQTVDHVMTTLKLYILRGLDKVESTIREAVSGLTPWERTVFTVCGDLWAFKDNNGDTLRAYLDGILYKPTTPAENPDEIFSTVFDDIQYMASQMNASYTKGTSTSELKEKDPVKYGLLAAHVKSIQDHLVKWKDFINHVIAPLAMPMNLHSVPEMSRKAVPGSDTDSSIFTVAGLVGWYHGSTDFNDSSKSTSSAIAFTATQSIANAMAHLSDAMGVREDQFYRLAMKSEYFFPVMVLNNAQKHYCSLIEVREGKVYDEPELEVKGVNFKNSRLPSKLMDLTNKWYEKLMLDIMDNHRLTPEEIMALPVFIEHSIRESIESSRPHLYVTAKLRERGHYGDRAMSSVYAFVDLWNDVFANKYGAIVELPSTAVKVNVNLSSKARTKAFIASLPEDMASSMEAWCTKNNRWKFTYLIVPQHMIATGFIPVEITPYVDIDKVLSTLTTQFYMYMDSFGVYRSNDKNNDWVSDSMSKSDAIKHSRIDLSGITVEGMNMLEDEDEEDE